jgi:peptide/nickel transport system substrate-binding protein
VEAVVNDLGAIGIRAKVQPLERAAIQGAQRAKKVKNLTFMGSGAPGNAATRVEAFMYSHGVQSFLKDPEIDQWFEQQSRERNRTKREACCTRFNRRCMTKPTSYRFGSWASYVSPDHGWRSPAWD